MTSNRVFAQAAFSQATRYLGLDWRIAVLTLALVAIPSLLADVFLDEAAINFIVLVTSLLASYAQLLLTFRMPAASGAAPPGYDTRALAERRYPSWFGASMLSTVAIFIGLLALAVPGILLFLLWSLAMPALAAERLLATAALARSWQLARPRLAALSLIALTFVGMVTLLFLAAVIGDTISQGGLWSKLLTDIVMPAIMLFGATVWTGAYLIAVGEDSADGRNIGHSLSPPPAII